MADSIIKLKKQEINSISQFDELTKKFTNDRENLLDKIKKN